MTCSSVVFVFFSCLYINKLKERESRLYGSYVNYDVIVKNVLSNLSYIPFLIIIVSCVFIVSQSKNRYFKVYVNSVIYLLLN